MGSSVVNRLFIEHACTWYLSSFPQSVLAAAVSDVHICMRIFIAARDDGADINRVQFPFFPYSMPGYLPVVPEWGNYNCHKR